MVGCFMLEPTGTVQVGLRRYSDARCPMTPQGRGSHDATTLTGVESGEYDSDGYLQPRRVQTPREDPRWPQKCERCDYGFDDSDSWQDWQEQVWRRADTGELLTLRSAPPGAMWDAWWLPWKGPDGRSIAVRTPDGYEWSIDGVASNCSIHTGQSRKILPYDSDPSSPPEAHRCWIRHGDPPSLTVDKNGHTCTAGAGSIATPGYHGFLVNGSFT